jgi:hypothetical protein
MRAAMPAQRARERTDPMTIPRAGDKGLSVRVTFDALGFGSSFLVDAEAGMSFACDWAGGCFNRHFDLRRP